MENQVKLSLRERLTPGQRTALDVAIMAGFVICGAMIGSTLGRVRGYREGLRDGALPPSKERLDAAERQGYTKGWYDGAWANESESFRMGVKIGAREVQEMRQNMQAPAQAQVLQPA